MHAEGEIAYSRVESLSWHQVWICVWTNPGVESFRAILNDPNANFSRGATWVAAALFIPAILGVRGNPDISAVFSSMLCTLILVPFFATVALAILAGIYRLVASLYGGHGSFDHLAYCIAAAAAPGMLLSTPISLLQLLLQVIEPGMLVVALLYGLSIARLLISLYQIGLIIFAISAVEGFGIGKAILTYFTPAVVVFALIFCYLLFTLSTFFRG